MNLKTFRRKVRIMPTYEYECSGCDHSFEEFQSMKDKPLVVCPQCKKRKLRRLISAGAGIIFKGSGFYETDYRSDSYKKGAAKEKEAASEASKDSKGSDTKKGSSGPDSKKESKKKDNK